MGWELDSAFGGCCRCQCVTRDRRGRDERGTKEGGKDGSCTKKSALARSLTPPFSRSPCGAQLQIKSFFLPKLSTRKVTTDSSSRDRRSQTDGRTDLWKRAHGRSQWREGGILPKGAENATNGFPWPLAAGERRAGVSQGRNGLCPDPEGEEQLPPLSCSVRPRRNLRIRNLFLGGEREWAAGWALHIQI